MTYNIHVRNDKSGLTTTTLMLMPIRSLGVYERRFTRGNSEILKRTPNSQTARTPRNSKRHRESSPLGSLETEQPERYQNRFLTPRRNDGHLFIARWLASISLFLIYPLKSVTHTLIKKCLPWSVTFKNKFSH